MRISILSLKVYFCNFRNFFMELTMMIADMQFNYIFFIAVKVNWLENLWALIAKFMWGWMMLTLWTIYRFLTGCNLLNVNWWTDWFVILIKIKINKKVFSRYFKFCWNIYYSKIREYPQNSTTKMLEDAQRIPNICKVPIKSSISKLN